MPVKKHHTIELSNGRALDMSRTLVMGVLNVTPDSFSDGGRFLNPVVAVTRAQKMIQDGADIIDIGGESTRPGARKITADEEIQRTIPIIESVRKSSDIPISIDTAKSEVAKAALETGADIVNDISALRFDPDLADVIKKHNAPAILMHMLGTPETMQVNPHYDDCIKEITDFLKERITCCLEKGISQDKIIIDPGIGFGKRIKDNLSILKNLDKFRKLGHPVLVGASRKSFIAGVTGNKNIPDQRIGGSLAAIFYAVNSGCEIVRVHDVAETVEAIKVLNAVQESV